MEVEEKIEEMQKYIPCLRLLIDNLEKNPAKEEQVKKMKYLLEMLMTKDPSIKLETLVRCEGILQKIYGKEQILSSSVENDSRKGETEVQNENKAQETSNFEAASDPNKSKLVNGNSSETTRVVDSQSLYSTKTTVNDTEKQLVVKNDEDKGGGDGVFVVDSSKSKLEVSSHKVEGSNNGKEKDESDSTYNSGLIIQKAESLTCHTSKTELKANKFEETTSKPLQLENDVKSNDSIKNSSANYSKNIEDDEPKVVNEPTGDDCDMDIDEELTNSIVSKALSESQVSESHNSEDSAKNKEIKSAEGSKEVSTSTPTKKPSSKSNFVDLTSDDSNDETPTTPVPPIQKMTPNPVNKKVEKINLQPTKPSEKPAVVYLIKQNDETSNSQTQTQNKVPNSTSSAEKVEKNTPSKADNEPNKTIMTIDLLDSDSDDEGKSNSKSKSSKSDGKVQMPTPKMLGDKPMFTIASVQSISTLQQHQEKRREVEKELYAIVKSIQYTTHHTVPQKHNAAVTAYLERFIKDLMFEKNRVNLCLQKLLKTLEPEKYKQVKKIIQTYCSEPVNDANLPTPSPFCHRIKVYPEKLQFVMRQMFFFNTGISVVGYKVFALSKNIQTPNGVVKSSTTSPGMDQKKSPQMPGGLTIINQKAQLARSILPKPPPLIQRCMSSPAGKPSPITPPTSSSGSNLLAPMKSQSLPTQPIQKPKRRKHASDDDDDDDDENYVPQGYFSESDEQTEEPSDTPRRTSLQRASKIRCQKYLELERAIDDETYIRATEATLARALKGEGRPKTAGSQPPLKKYKPASALKKKRPSQIEDDGDSKASQESDTREREDDTEDDSQPARKRAKRTDKKNPDGKDDMDQEELDDEDDEPAPELDTTVENTAKNITRAYHCRSKYLEKCLICHERMLKKCAISHYVSAHREREVFIARLHKGDILKLQSETMCFAFPSSNAKSSAYVAYCIFCRQEQCLSMRYWYEHYTRHTGEYLYECSQCKARRSTRQQINRHVNIECSKKGSSVVVLKEIDPDIIRIDACVCMLCNYVQLDFERLVRHLQNEHEFPGAIHELPEGTYQVLNLLRIEQNYYDSSKIDNSTGIPSEMEEMIPEDDMSFMICNMLASTNDQVPSEPSVAGGAMTNEATVVPPVATDSLVAVDAVNEVEPIRDPLQSDDILLDSMSKPDDERPQTPEMIVPDEPIMPAVIVRTDEDEDESELPSMEADTNIEKTSTSPSRDVVSELGGSTTGQTDPEIHEDNKLSDSALESQHSMETLQMEDSTGSVSADMDSAVQDQNSTESQTQNKSDQISDSTSTTLPDSKDDSSMTNALDSDSNIQEQDPLDTSSDATEKPKSLLSELNSLEDLTKSATESIFQRVSDSLINSVYESVEVATSVSESTSELADTNAISSENTLDSEESGPQFLQPTQSPIDPVLLTVHETIVPDLDSGNVAESSEQTDKKEEDSQVAEAQGADDMDDLILPESMENSPGQAECITDELIIPECYDEIANSDKLDSCETAKMNEEEKEPEILPGGQKAEDLPGAVEKLSDAAEELSDDAEESPEAAKELLEAAEVLPEVAAEDLLEAAEILPHLAEELPGVLGAEMLPDSQVAESIEANEASGSIEELEGAPEESNVAQISSEKGDQLEEITETTTMADTIEEPQTDSESVANPEPTTIDSYTADSKELKETNPEQESTAEATTIEPQEPVAKIIVEEPIVDEADDKVEEASVDTSAKVDIAANKKSTENSPSETANEESMDNASSEVDKAPGESSTQPSPPETTDETANETQESSSIENAHSEKNSD